MCDEPLSAIFEHPMRVPGEVIDENGHANNVAYLQWMNEVALRHFEALGGKPLMERFGAAWVARSHRIEYLRPVFEGDELVMRTWIASMQRVKSLRRYEFEREGVVIATGETEWVFVDAESGRPKRIPAEMGEAVRAAD